MFYLLDAAPRVQPRLVYSALLLLSLPMLVSDCPPGQELLGVLQYCFYFIDLSSGFPRQSLAVYVHDNPLPVKQRPHSSKDRLMGKNALC